MGIDQWNTGKLIQSIFVFKYIELSLFIIIYSFILKYANKMCKLYRHDLLL